MKFNLQCEYLYNPIGIDILKPRFCFPASSDRVNHKQISYQILVSNDAELTRIIWDSGVVNSGCSISIPYAGLPLASFTRYYWKVVIFDNLNERYESETAWFITGMQPGDQWMGQWIGPAVTRKELVRLRKTISHRKPIKEAIAAVAGLGYYQLHVNGERLGDELLCNATTDYSKTILYRCFDLKPYLLEQGLELEVDLAKGWYKNPVDSVGASGVSYNLFMEVRVVYEDGSKETICSEKDGWEYTCDTPFLSSDVYDGEMYDARRENRASWKWQPVVRKNSPGGTLVSEYMEPVRITEELPCQDIYKTGAESYTLDFGQNISGVVKMNISGDYGQEVIIRHAELIHDNHTLNQVSNRTALVEDRYIFGENKDVTYAPTFTYHGFRYAEVSGLSYFPKKEDFTALVIHNDVDKTIEFACGNDVINGTFRNVLWTERDNLHGVPTDCPQRNERLGWLNDMTVRAEGALYNYKLANFYAKWCRDMVDTQGDSGAISDTAPHRLMGQSPADPVSSSFVLIPWLLYVFYGDKNTMETFYQQIKVWVDYLADNSTDYIVNYSYYGDWASAYAYTVRNSLGAGAVSAITPGRLVSTGHQYLNCRTLAKIAHVLGSEEDYIGYNALADKIAIAMNEEFYSHNHRGSQASNSLALYLGVARDSEKLLQNLIEDIQEKDYHFSTGNLCTRYMLEALSMYGKTHDAFILASQTTYPSYGYMLEKGATTIWERWEFVDGGELAGMGSHNHPMYGSVCLWYYRYLLGIRPCEEAPGFAKIIVKPHYIAELGYAKGSYLSPMGKISVEWKYEDNLVQLSVVVPFNCEAEIHTDTINCVGSGKHEFSFVLPQEM